MGTVEESAPHGMSLLILQMPSFRIEWNLEKQRLSCRKKTKRENELLIKDKGNLFHSALYCDLNLLEVRPKRATTPNWQEYHAVSSMGFEKS